MKTFTQLKKSMSAGMLDKVCKNLVIEYASSGPEKSEKYFCTKYGVTTSCYRKMKDYALEHLVSAEIVNKAMQKAIANQKLNHPQAGYSSVKKTHRIYMNRQMV